MAPPDVMGKIESITLYDAAITLSTKPEERPNYSILICEAIAFWPMQDGDCQIEMIRQGKRIRWRYRGRYLVRYEPLPIETD